MALEFLCTQCGAWQSGEIKCEECDSKLVRPQKRGSVDTPPLISDLRTEISRDALFNDLDKNGVKARPVFLAGFDEIEALLSAATAVHARG